MPFHGFIYLDMLIGYFGVSQALNPKFKRVLLAIALAEEPVVYLQSPGSLQSSAVWALGFSGRQGLGVCLMKGPKMIQCKHGFWCI